tara:strand:- start:468 stop:1676 length:1209 start_codon:yes stop_codon:yes gene_type:complete
MRALRTVEDKLDIYLMNIPWGQTGNVNYTDEEIEWLEQLQNKTAMYQQAGGTYDISLQITIPNEFVPMAPLNVGFTAGIETSKTAPEWVEKGNMMNKIILVSDHSRNVYQNTSYQATNSETGEVNNDFRCTVPMETVNYSVRGMAPPSDLDIELDYDFNFLAVAQFGPRKNLPNTIRWFVEEFIDQEVGLVVKTNMAADCIGDHINTQKYMNTLLAEYPNRKCKVYLLHGTLDEGQLSALYTHEKIKAFVSLTHGEGFGLPIFEAVCNALPVICPLWSGQMDFLYAPVKDKKTKKEKVTHHCAKVEYDIKPVQPEVVWPGVLVADSLWCYARPGSYKMKLREVLKNHGRFKSQANRLQKHVLSEFTDEKQYKKFTDSILELMPRTKEEEEWEGILEQVVNYE